MSNRGSEIRPFRVEIPQQALDDLRDQLDRVRWTTEVPGQAPEGKLQWFMDHKISFNQLHAQQPQTLAHAPADSPAGLLGWNAQLMAPDAMGGKHLDDDFILTNVALYWFTNTGGSAIRFYYEDAHGPRQAEPTTVPLGVQNGSIGSRSC